MSDAPTGEGVIGVSSVDNNYKYVTTFKMSDSSISYGNVKIYFMVIIVNDYNDKKF